MDAYNLPPSKTLFLNSYIPEYATCEDENKPLLLLYIYFHHLLILLHEIYYKFLLLFILNNIELVPVELKLFEFIMNLSSSQLPFFSIYPNFQ
jgi:hypothetical protein